MKIALCLSGLIRNFHGNYFSNIYENLDIFCHTWDYCDVSQLKLPNIKEIVVENDFNAFNSTTVNIKHWPHRCKSPRENVYKMYYGMKQCIEMVENYEKQNNFKYDLIIRSRYDIKSKLNKKLLNNIKNNLNKNDIIFPLKGFWVGKTIETKLYTFENPIIENKIIRVNDSFFIGNESCRLLSKTYNHFELLKNGYKAILHNENLIAHMCIHYNFNVVLKNFECNLCRDGRL